jgi:abortive infection bacteriophage resistance protein
MGTLYTKQPISIADQIAKLKSLGLVIADEAKAEKTLGEVSYFRFAAYLRPMEADKLYAFLCCMVYWLSSMGYGDEFKAQIKQLVAQYRSVDVGAMGFPTKWGNEPLWL